MDRISNLHDSVLSQILSYLPTKLAASTCVLSKRWQFLCTKLHNVDLECNTFKLRKDLEGPTTERFVNFVNKFLTERDKDLSIKRFRLKFWSSPSPIHVDSWVLAAITSSVEEIDIDLALGLDPKNGFLFRCGLFACKTLVVLKLKHLIAIDAPSSSIHLPCLKVLHLLSVIYENEHSFSNLFSGCPILETLVLEGICAFDSDYVISSTTLREFVVSLDCNPTRTRLWVDAPNLEYLNVQLFGPDGVYLKNLGNLVNAVADLHGHRVYLDVADGDDEMYDTELVKDSLQALYNVRVLKLERSILDALQESSFEDFPLFHNLIQLELVGFCCFWGMLVSLLKKLPYLERLTLRIQCCTDQCCVYLESVAWAKLEVLNCLIRLIAFELVDENDLSSDCDDMQFVTYVLKNATVLENMTITCQRPLIPEKKSSFKRKLASLKRRSKKCQLRFEGEVL